MHKIKKHLQIQQIQELTARIPFDDRINQQVNLNDLNLGLIREFLQEIKSDLYEESATMSFADLCRQMNIAKGSYEALRPVNAGLKELHLTEGRGTGIPTIYRVMENNGSPPPVIETDEQCTYFITVLPFNYQFTFQENKISDQNNDQNSDLDGDQVNDQVVWLLKYALKAKSREELLSHLGLKNNLNFYQ